MLVYNILIFFLNSDGLSLMMGNSILISIHLVILFFRSTSDSLANSLKYTYYLTILLVLLLGFGTCIGSGTLKNSLKSNESINRL